MPTKDSLKSARKIFMVNRVKTSILALNKTKDEDVEAELEKLLAPLAKTFGDVEGLAILEDAISAADKVITDAIAASVVETVKENNKGK
jgi:hypothetical protein